MKDTFSSFSQRYISRHWAFVLFTLLVPISLNLIAIMVSEIKLHVVSNYFHTYKLMGVKPTISWFVFILEISIALTLIALVGFLAKILLKRINENSTHKGLGLVLSAFIIVITSLFYSLGTRVIDLIWSMTFYMGPGFGLPRSSLFRINTISSFLVITLVFIFDHWIFNKVHVNDRQPNPRST